MVKSNSKIPVFFCIPDITGFTKFMTSANNDFAHEIIPKILRMLVKSNILDMNIAEIEGDAIFFYKTGRMPAISKVAKQCQAIYEGFINCIESYKESDPVNYKKYLADNQLGIKMIIHTGLISITKIEGRTKLLGEDVILVHKLLKNNVPEFNYILLTSKYTNKLKDKKSVSNWFNWENLKEGIENYEHFGEVRYNYISLNYIKNISKKKALLSRNPKRTVQILP